MKFFEYVFKMFPVLSESGHVFGISGKGWRTFYPTDKFLGALKNRGPKELGTIIFRELDPRLDIRFDRDPLDCGRVNIACSIDEWNDKGGSQILRDLLDFLEVDYGHLNPTKYFNIDHFHRVAAAPTFEGSLICVWEPPASDKLLPASTYEELLSLWERDRGYRSKDPVVYVERPVLVYPVSVLCDFHLSIPVRKNCSLRDWIGQRSDRGVIENVNQVNYFWKVEPDCIESVTKELWTAGFFNASEHFEIGGWDGELQLPLFRHIKQLERHLFKSK
ncbi:hypothetical protein [Stieleria varia]|uniref:hypothetical protein n=1 Tax=Stieleria varia TaxID=2528005 RepID=UPI0011B58DE4|nr:hypothetical protein [Stieleria varia]